MKASSHIALCKGAVEVGSRTVRARRFAPLSERLAMHSIPEPNSGCLLWLGGVTKDGYGKMDVREPGMPGVHRMVGVHRVALEQKLGRRLLPGEHACHKCDVKLCIAEDHLFPGSNRDNVRDKMAKGRQYKGARPRNKLSCEQIISIRHEMGSDALIATKYGVSRQRVQHIRSAARGHE